MKSGVSQNFFVGKVSLSNLLVSLLLMVVVLGCAPKANWTTFQSTEGKFSVLMPGEPKQETQPVQTAIGSISMVQFRVDLGRKVSYGVIYADYPATLIQRSNPEAILSGARDGAIKKVKGKLIKEEKITISGYPGRDLTIEITGLGTKQGKGLIRVRVYLVRQRLYQVMAVVPQVSEEVTNFLNSFRLL